MRKSDHEKVSPTNKRDREYSILQEPNGTDEIVEKQSNIHPSMGTEEVAVTEQSSVADVTRKDGIFIPC